MILIAIEHKEHTFILNAADTYLGCFTQLSGGTIDELLLRSSPTFRAWADLQKTGELRKQASRSKSRP